MAIRKRMSDRVQVDGIRQAIVRRDLITGLRHEGGGVWHALLGEDLSMRIGRKYLADVKKLAGK